MSAPNHARTENLKTSARRHPVAALLMVLSLLAGSGGAAAARQAGDPAARIGRERPGAAAAFARAPERRLVSDDVSEAKPKSSLPPPVPAVVTGVVGTRPGGEGSPDTGASRRAAVGGVVSGPSPSSSLIRPRRGFLSYPCGSRRIILLENKHVFHDV